MARPWSFYGRQAEIGRLQSFMDAAPGFGVYAVRGRRKVGKSALVRRFFTHEREADPSRPVVSLNLERSAPPHYYGDLEARVGADMNRPDLLEEFVPWKQDPILNFARLVQHLLKRNCTVVLDEFQRIARPGPAGEEPRLPSLFQEVLDEVRQWSRDHPGVAPRLIVMGSEQQKLMELFQDATQPLRQQLIDTLHVRPWDFSDIAEAAAGMGWDARPDRLLTLWTAYGGMPGHWERFASQSPHLAAFNVAMEDGAWTDAFLAAEETHRHTPDGDFASQMEIQLRPADRALLVWLAEGEKGRDVGELFKNRKDPRGQEILAALGDGFRERPEAVAHAIACDEAAAVREKRAPDPEGAVVRAALREVLERRLSGKHLGLVSRRDAIDDSRAERWWVSDEHARFQLDVLEKAAVAGSGPAPLTGREFADFRRTRMQRAEGGGLETLALAALAPRIAAGSPEESVRHGAWRRKPDAEIDMLAVAEDALWGIFAKRSPRGHDPVQDSSHVSNWLRPLTSPRQQDSEKTLARRRAMERRLLFVSPSFDDDALAALAARIDETVRTDPGAQAVRYWYAMDIRDMLDGNAPVPLKTQEPGPPETEKEEDGGDGSGGSMSGGPGS